MEKKYREVDFYFGNLEKAVEELEKHKNKGELVFIEFNGVKLFSDVDDLDSAFVKVTGKTKSEFDELERIRREEYENEERKHKESIPQLTIEWIEKGKSILDEKYHYLWIKCVPIRLKDLYKGMELEMCLDIVKRLNEGCSLDESKEIVESQGHSGMSFGLICSMVKSFCDRGTEFVEYVRL